MRKQLIADVSGWKAILKALDTLRGTEIKVGFLGAKAAAPKREGKGPKGKKQEPEKPEKPAKEGKKRGKKARKQGKKASKKARKRSKKAATT